MNYITRNDTRQDRLLALRAFNCKRACALAVANNGARKTPSRAEIANAAYTCSDIVVTCARRTWEQRYLGQLWVSVDHGRPPDSHLPLITCGRKNRSCRVPRRGNRFGGGMAKVCCNHRGTKPRIGNDVIIYNHGES